MYEYEHIIPIDYVKNYLRVENSFTDDDLDIIRMTNGAFQYVEMQTGHIMHNITDTVSASPYECKISEFRTPIISFNSEDEDNPEPMPLYYANRTVFHSRKMTMQFGYSGIENVPNALINAILEIVKVWYYEHEKNEFQGLIPPNVLPVIETYRRFIVC